MWRGYGTEGGYAIEFFKDKLIALFESARTVCQGEVGYPEEKTLRKGMIPDFLSKQDQKFDHAGQLKNCIKEVIFPDYFKDGASKKITYDQLRAILKIKALIKHPGFHEESEYRFAVWEYRNTNPPVNIFQKDKELIEYWTIPLNLDCIKSIVIGPQRAIEDKKVFLETYVKNKGLKLKVKASNIPFIS